MRVGLAGPEEMAFLALEDPEWVGALSAEQQNDLGTGLAIEHRLIIACEVGTDDWQVVVDCRLNGTRYSFPFPVRTCEPVIDSMIAHGQMLLCDNEPPNMQIAVTLTVDEKAVAGLRLARGTVEGNPKDKP